MFGWNPREIDGDGWKRREDALINFFSGVSKVLAGMREMLCFCFFVRDSQMSSIGMLNALWKPLAKMESNPNPDPTMLNQ
jgi:hypothetical protein